MLGARNWKQMIPALISLTFDDGLRCQFERAVPILDQYDLSATFFLVANTDPIHTDGEQHPDWRKISWSDDDIQSLKTLVRHGHEIGAHSVSHKYPFLDTNPRHEAEGSKAYSPEQQRDLYSVNCRLVAFDNPDIVVVGELGHKVGRDGSENVGGWLQSDWYVLMFHGIGTLEDGWWPISVTEFARQMMELAKFRDSGAAEIVTFAEGANRLRAVNKQ
jgi:Polysaccharide deacetylase